MLAPGVLSNPWVQEDASMDEIVDVDMDVKVDADERVDAGLDENNSICIREITPSVEEGR